MTETFPVRINRLGANQKPATTVETNKNYRNYSAPLLNDTAYGLQPLPASNVVT
jgi:hypothetical protein